MANFDIRQVIVDNGSSINFIFLSTLRKIKFDLRKVELAKSNVTGFSGKVKVPEGRITSLPWTSST